MKEFNSYNLNIQSDFLIKVFRENEVEIDLIISLDKRTTNLYIKDMPKFIPSRIQFNDVNSILIRLCKDLNNNIGTIHFLSDSGIHSTMSNFEINYLNHNLHVMFKEYYVDFLIN